MIDYIGFSFEDFDKDCIVLVNNLPKSFNEDKLLRLFHPMGRIRVIGKAFKVIRRNTALLQNNLTKLSSL